MAELKNIMESGDIRRMRLGDTDIVRIANYPLQDRSPSIQELVQAFDGVPEHNLFGMLRDDDSRRLFLVFYDARERGWYFTLMRRAKAQ